ncbi:tetratricopeptide repeat protein [Rubrivivax rivuli]|uniref:Sel1 repeat family protein n=1 Tax=Rubrivivax rivuli TaxID=1862385 RepID=A0A437RRY6_9BURK|nr:SEL1-like repeat protein [Rubrivivax rivuli]RVU49402.1 sel1 repeat family protein [Rubrivivax rivuli]
MELLSPAKGMFSVLALLALPTAVVLYSLMPTGRKVALPSTRLAFGLLATLLVGAAATYQAFRERAAVKPALLKACQASPFLSEITADWKEASQRFCDCALSRTVGAGFLSKGLASTLGLPLVAADTVRLRFGLSEPIDIVPDLTPLADGRCKSDARWVDPMSMWTHGVSHLWGLSSKELNYALGVKWVTKAAESGLARAQGTLGSLYLSGEYGQAKDDALARSWLTKGAAQSDPRSLYLLGYMHLMGRGGLKEDAIEGRRLIAKAKELGFADASPPQSSPAASSSR